MAASSESASPERSKRRLSPPPTGAKRHRPDDGADGADVDWGKESMSQPRRTPLHPQGASTSSSHSSLPYPLTTSPSSSGSEDPATVNLSRRRISRSRQMPDVPPSSVPGAEPDRRFSGPRWTTAQSSSNSSSSSSHPRPPPVTDGVSGDDRPRSPPTRLTLSTGQPLVNPPLKTQAAFVGKLFSMLEDEEIGKTGLIHWSSGGSTFTCPNPTEFAKFNKVNDLYATSDPLAWEFRHPLFRQGESHLLASIKRKTTRATPAEALSPTDEMVDARPVAGWMRDDGFSGGPSSPPRSIATAPPVPRSEVFGYNMMTGETIQSRPYDPAYRGLQPAPTNRGPGGKFASDLASFNEVRSSSGHPPQHPAAQDRPSRAQSQRYHQVPDFPPASAHSDRSTLNVKPHLDVGPGAYPDSGQYPQPSIPSPSPIMALTSQVASLEERIGRLSDALSVERVENTRTQMEMLSYIASMALWLPDAPAREISALRDSLDRQTSELKQKYDALIAVDTLAQLASGHAGQGGGGEYRGNVSDRRPPHEADNYSSHRPPSGQPGMTSSYLPPPTRSYPDQQHPQAHSQHRPTPRTSPINHTHPILSRRPSITSSTTLPQIPQMPSGAILPVPKTSERPATSSNALVSFDQPPFSRSPLMHRPASTPHIPQIAAPAVQQARRASAVPSSGAQPGLGQADGEAKRLGASWDREEDERMDGKGRTPSVPGIRDLLN